MRHIILKGDEGYDRECIEELGITPHKTFGEIYIQLNETEDEKVYFFSPFEKEILVEDMRKIVDASEKLIKELKDGKNIMLVSRQG